MKKCFWRLMFVMLLLFSSVTAFAEGIISPFYSNTRFVQASLTIDNGTAICEGSVKPKNTNENASISVDLQQKVGKDWKK